MISHWMPEEGPDRRLVEMVTQALILSHFHWTLVVLVSTVPL